MLTPPPSLTAEALFSGEYTRRLSAHLSDHLPARTRLLTAKAAAEHALLKGENNSIMALPDGYLVKRFDYSPAQRDTLRRNGAMLESLTAELSATGRPAHLVLAPRGVDVLGDPYEAPALSPWPALAEAAPSAHTVTALLRQKAALGEAVWYRTDHHWQGAGAFAVYETLGEPLGFQPLPRSEFRETVVCEDFFGTSHSATLAPFCRADTITAFRYEGDEDFVCTDVLTGQSTKGLYRPEALCGKDKYTYFLGPNTAHLKITRWEAAPRPSLLVIKDSYAQCLAPFLLRHFDIHLVDLRYFRTDPSPTLRAILSEPTYAGALLLLNADTLTGEIPGLTALANNKF